MFLGWILARSMQLAPAGQDWSVIAIVVTGPVLMLVARFGLRSVFFASPRESGRRPSHRATGKQHAR